MALRGLKESLALMVLMELMVLTVWTAQTALRGLKVILEIQDRKDHRVTLDHRVHKVMLALLGLKVILGLAFRLAVMLVKSWQSLTEPITTRLGLTTTLTGLLK